MSSDRLAQLTAMQSECLRGIYQQKSSKTIATELGLSPGTVDRRIKEALRVLGLQNRQQAASILAESKRIYPSRDIANDSEPDQSKQSQIPIDPPKFHNAAVRSTADVLTELAYYLHGDGFSEEAFELHTAFFDGSFYDKIRDLFSKSRTLSLLRERLISANINTDEFKSDLSIDRNPTAEEVADYIASALKGSSRTPCFADQVLQALEERLPELRATVDVSRSVPKEAPELWPGGRGTSETPPEFIQRVYGEWLGKGLTLADVRKRDEPLAQAYYHHRRQGRPLPEGFDLPTRPELNTRWVERVEREGLAAVIPEGSPESVLREARRLTAAKHRRGRITKT